MFDCKISYPTISYFGNKRVCTHEYLNGESFQFDKKTHRFLYAIIDVAGYLDDKKSNTPALVGGTCKKF